MSSKTFTITARQFRDLVSPVLPLASKDRTLPILNAVQLRTTGEYLTAGATDRFRLGVKRAAVVIDPPKGLLAVVATSTVRSILAIFKPTKHADPELEFTFTDDSLTVQAVGFDLGGSAGVSGELTYPLTKGDYPPIARLIEKALSNETSAEPVHLNPSYLADFQHAQTHGDPMAVRFAGPAGSVVVSIGEDFIGLVQPIRFPEAKGVGEGWAKTLAEATKADDAATKKRDAAAAKWLSEKGKAA